ncbi:hypothetical protein STEG23_003064, partial [Scotinomys teguina]
MAKSGDTSMPSKKQHIMEHRKGQVSHEYEQSMAYQVKVRISIFPSTKTGQ